MAQFVTEESNMRAIFKLLLVLFFISFLMNCKDKGGQPSPLFFEIHGKGAIKQVVVKPKEVLQVGIDERGLEPTIRIEIAPKHHSIIERITKENLGGEIIIRTDNGTVFSGTIKEPISKGVFAFACRSVQDAEKLFEKMGRKPDYYLKLTPQELEASKRYTEPYKSPLAQKAFDAFSYGDYTKAEELAKKAIESDPNEGKYHHLLGAIYYLEDKKKLALEELLATERLSSKEDLKRSAGLYLSIARLYEEFNEYEKSIEYLKKVLFNNDSNTLARLHLAENYEKVGKRDLAMQEYRLLSESGDEQVREKGLEGIRRLKGNRK
jgi:hypothetical protein